MSGAGSVRKADAAVRVAKFAGGAVKLIDMNQIQAQVTDENFIPYLMKGRKMGVGTFLAVGKVVSGAAVLPGIAERADAAVAAEVIEGDASAAVIGAEKKLSPGICAYMAGALSAAGKGSCNGKRRGTTQLHGQYQTALRGSADGIQNIPGGSGEISGVGNALSGIQSIKGPAPEIGLAPVD